MSGKRDLRQSPELDGWLLFPDAADVIGISRQRLFQLAEKDEPPVIKTVVRIGRRRTIYAMREVEAMDLKQRREAAGKDTPWEDL